MKIVQIPTLSDNYSYLVICKKTSQCLIIDPAETQPVISKIQELNLTPIAILNTHHHYDHTGGNADLLKNYTLKVFAGTKDANRIASVTNTVKEGDVIRCGELSLNVIDVPGHTSGHIAFIGDNALFSGDTLFAGGCGRIFEGTPEQMHNSLTKLTSLPDETKLYCAHEYTKNNLTFALTLEPSHPDLNNKLIDIKSLEKDSPTILTTIGEEKTYNPFLRWDSTELIQSLTQKGFTDLGSPAKVFAATRRLKDTF